MTHSQCRTFVIREMITLQKDIDKKMVELWIFSKDNAPCYQ